jgi:hypothetical protein
MTQRAWQSVWSEARRPTLARWLRASFPSRLVLYVYDYWMMRVPVSLRYRQLVEDHLVCRFCGYPIELLGAWQCACGYKRPGNYYGRCPNCLDHPHFIDCPACGFTMDVR